MPGPKTAAPRPSDAVGLVGLVLTLLLKEIEANPDWGRDEIVGMLRRHECHVDHKAVQV